MILKYEDFIERVFGKFAKHFTKNEISEILNNAFEFEKDTPVSTGKRLILNKVIVKGIKSNEKIIDYEYRIFKGINMLIADNLKGKSSLFKIITFALTGNNKLKNDVKKWIKEIILGFQINERKYTVILNLKSRSLIGMLYNKDIDRIKEWDKTNEQPIFQANGIDNYAEEIQKFFFKQFSYYSLKWTQKASGKGRVELLEARASWKTYFKSIYLESKDSSSLMYGGQGKKVFKMLMGLELTYAINYLTVMKEKLQFEIAKEETFNSNITSSKSLMESLNKQILDIEIQLNSIKEGNNKKYQISDLYKEYDHITNVINQKIEKLSYINKEINKINKSKEIIEVEVEAYKKELKRVDREKNKAYRNINDIKEYLDIGMFFSDLNIKRCPSCSKEISKKENTLKDSTSCPLCHEKVKIDKKKNNKQLYVNKLQELKGLVQKLEREKNKLLEKINSLRNKIDNYNIQVKKIEIEKSSIDKKPLEGALIKIEDRINEVIKITKPIQQKEIELSSKRAILKYQIDALKEGEEKNIKNKKEKKVKLLEYVIKELIDIRYQRSKKILDNLSDIMLYELHNFGLNTISEINITSNYDIRYKQDGEFIKFDDIAEGEQLRAKIAFYLAIIQLDIDKNFGRHTRFLIIDSPNKEEGDSKYLTGLSDVLKDIEKRYDEDLQILIGTATRSLANIVEHEKIYGEGEFVF